MPGERLRRARPLESHGIQRSDALGGDVPRCALHGGHRVRYEEIEERAGYELTF